jgi:hypothetical protein
MKDDMARYQCTLFRTIIGPWANYMGRIGQTPKTSP